MLRVAIVFASVAVALAQYSHQGCWSATSCGFGWLLYVWYEDALEIGIKCFVICGDADGNGNPDGTSAALAGLGGIDQPRYSLSESALIAFDFNGDGTLDFMVGYPASESSQSDQFPCANRDLYDNTCFGLYRYQNGRAYSQAQYRFQWVNNDPALGASPTTHARDNNVATSSARPDLEWTITGLNVLLANAGLEQVDYNGVRPWRINFLAFQGSFEDDGIGEDFMPGSNQIIPIEWECRTFDACGVCGGNGSTCADCAGNPNGNAVYDACDVCNGDNTSCMDCARIPNGPSTYDVCDVCNGNGQSCLDCANTPNGGATYDVCDVCNGNGRSCLDCAGVPNGPADYDDCGVCNGVNSRDVCDVCLGNGQSCLDCAGTPNGPAVYDQCNVCNGDGTSCLDCANVPFGSDVYDVCDVCGGFGNTCLDCAGIPNGPGDYDDCGVCNGDGKSCRCDGALLVQNCDHPLTLVRSVCVQYQGRELSQEVWLDPYDGAREIHYFVKRTEEYVGDATSVDVNQLQACPCGCE